LKYEIGVHQVNVDGISFWLDKQSWEGNWKGQVVERGATKNDTWKVIICLILKC
jgi:hypothetical protein